MSSTTIQKLALAKTSFSQFISNHLTNVILTLASCGNDEFSISCISCTAVGDFSISGGYDDDLPCLDDIAPDSNFSSFPFDFSEYWVGVVVERFNVHVELNVSLTPSNPTNEITIALIGADGLHIPEG